MTINGYLLLISVALSGGYAGQAYTHSGIQDEANCMEKPTAVLMIVSGVTKDRARMAAYSKALASSGLYEEAGGYYLNNPRAITVFEGALPKDHATLVVRFPSLEAAQSFWNSPVYQNEIKPMRENPSAGDYSVVVYQETDPPDYIR